jgi:hypothetical protein
MHGGREFFGEFLAMRCASSTKPIRLIVRDCLRERLGFGVIGCWRIAAQMLECVAAAALHERITVLTIPTTILAV